MEHLTGLKEELGDEVLLGVCEELTTALDSHPVAVGLHEPFAEGGEDADKELNTDGTFVAQCIEGQEIAMLKDFRDFMLQVRLFQSDAGRWTGQPRVHLSTGAWVQVVLEARGVPTHRALDFRKALWTLLLQVRSECTPRTASGSIRLRRDQGALSKGLEMCVSEHEPDPESLPGARADRCAASDLACASASQ